MSRNCIVPPHVLRNIREHGTPEEQESASRTLRLDQAARETRTSADAPPTSAERATDGVSAKRNIYDAAGGIRLPGTLVRAEGDASAGDSAVDEAYNGLGATLALYGDAFQRNSLDDAGQNLTATVHYGNRYNNALWNGSQLVFGDGDGSIFNRFTVAIDIIGHELTHGVTQNTARLAYYGQPGALNESLSDVFGSLVKQYHAPTRQTADQADWLIGVGIFTTAVNGVAIRSMKEPGTAYDDPKLGKDPQPASMDDYQDTFQDNGGVHINSGIPNRAFYLAATSIGGYAWETAGQIWYDTLTDVKLSAGATFVQFAALTVANAARFGSDVEGKVHEAWRQVAIEPSTLLAELRA